ncbi:hypothetical protein, partial [Mesorhizobium sp. CA16]|uniref:hypothetical protein n=1 Tax=Mesorhizobium sp. CA16 TaxID=588496 RepID=UPI001CCA0EC0
MLGADFVIVSVKPAQTPAIAEALPTSSFKGEAAAKRRREDPGIHSVTLVKSAAEQNSAPR